MSARLESCSTCRYFVPGAHSPRKDGTCHCHAPSQWGVDAADVPPPEEHDDGDGNITVTLQGLDTYTGWPDVLSSDWCGEYHAIPARRTKPRGAGGEPQ